jgi:hypothetical protein
MAVRASDGFDHYANFTDAASRVGNLGWYSLAPGNTIVTPGRGGFGKCLSIPVQSFASDATVGAFNANIATYYVGFAMTADGAPGGLSVLMYDPIGGGAFQCSAYFNFSAGQVTLYRGQDSTELATSSPASFSGTAWTFVEVMATINGTTGAIAVRCNNSPVVSITGVNTQTSGNASWGGVGLTATGGSGSILIDDFRYNDTTSGPGTYPCNSWLGDLRVATVFAIANDAVTWTPLAGTNWEEISETAFDGDTSYNSTATDGDEDLFNMGTLSAVIDEIVAVQLVSGAREADAGGHTFTQQLKIGGTDNAGATQALGTAYQFFSDIFPVNPTTGVSWTLSDVNSMLIGYKAVA